MVEITLDPILARWGPFAVSWHGLCLAAGVLTFYLLVVRQGKRAGITRQTVSELALWTFLVGVAAARLFHVIQHLATYSADPLRILAIYEGGLTATGGVGGVLLATILYARRKSIPIWQLTDLFLLGAPLASVVGRLGCLINGDVAGLPTGGSWGLVYSHPNAFVPSSLLGIPTFPAPVALQLWNLGLHFLQGYVRRHRPRAGIVTATYLLAHGLGRFLINIWQHDQVVALGLKYFQIVALGIVLSGAILALYLRFSRRRLPGGPMSELERAT